MSDDEKPPKNGRELRDEGTAKAEAAAAVQAWRDRFDHVLRAFASSGREFASEDITAALGVLPLQLGARSNNCVGARILAASKRGVIRKVGFRQALRSSRRAGAVAVWVGAGLP